MVELEKALIAMRDSLVRLSIHLNDVVFEADADLRQHATAEANAALAAYFSPSWTAFQAERGRDFSVIVDGISN
jgi:hypothetical protein